MPVQIGASTHGFSDPTGLLTDCHRRVEMFIGTLHAVALLCDRELSDDSRRSLEQALRYFREAAPKHTADEENSLFPRLRELDNEQVKRALQKLDALEEDHRWAEPLHAFVDTLGSRLLEEGKLAGGDIQEFREATGKLKAMYERHINVEEHDVFPVAAKALSSEMKNEIAREMASRRSVKIAL